MKDLNTRLLGRWGEEQTAAAYAAKGYELLAVNYRSRYGEIDLILRKKKTVVFTEVKLRKNADFAAAREFVSRAKQEKIIKTALLYLEKEGLSDPPVRFDVAEVYAPAGTGTAKPEIRVLEGAFDAGGREG